MPIIVFDFESTGTIFETHDIIEICARAYNAITLEAVPEKDGGLFHSLCRPMYPENADEQAMRSHMIPMETLMAAPAQKQVWKEFVRWVSRWNREKNIFTAPIPAGKNIRGFDLPFALEMCKRHCARKAETVLFNDRFVYDLEDDLRRWFAHTDELPSYGMDALREYMQMDKSQGHLAREDVRQTGDVLMKFLRLYRELFEAIDFRGLS